MAIRNLDQLMFAESQMNKTMLQDAVDFLADCAEPEDIFSREQLVDWAERNNFYESVEE